MSRSTNRLFIQLGFLVVVRLCISQGIPSVVHLQGEGKQGKAVTQYSTCSSSINGAELRSQ